jgi:hypothetical protein
MSLRFCPRPFSKPDNRFGPIAAKYSPGRRGNTGSLPQAGEGPNFGSMWDHLLVLLLVADSGNPGLQTLTGGSETLHVVVLTGLLLTAALRKGLQVSSLVVVPFLAFGFILLMQGVSFGFFPYITVMGFMVRLAIAGVVCILVPRFSLVFVRVMGILCGLSLLFWTLGFIGPWRAIVDTYGLRTSSAVVSDYPRISILVHTYWPTAGGFLDRNASMFWEPGALAGYLNLALLFLVCQQRRLPHRTHMRYLVLFTAGVLSTLSTGGYLGLLAVYSVGGLAGMQRSVLDLSLGRPRLKWPLGGGVILLAVAVVLAWNRVDFLGPKIQHQYEQAVSQEGAAWQMTRFGTMIQDWQYIRQRPLTGWGLRDETRWALHGGIHSDVGVGMGNDFSGFPARFGLLGMLTFIGLTWRGFQRLTGGRLSVSIVAVGVVLVILNGEAFLEHPAFLSLMFLPAASTGPGPGHRWHATPSWRWEKRHAAGGTSRNPARRIIRCHSLR